MRRPPQWTEFAKYPVTAGTIVLAAIATGAWWLGVDISPLLDDAHVRRGEVWRFVTAVLPHGECHSFPVQRDLAVDVRHDRGRDVRTSANARHLHLLRDLFQRRGVRHPRWWG